VLIGLAIVLASKKGSFGESRVRGAGVIMIGPIPIIFGTDKRSVKLALVLALALSIVILVIYLVYYGVLR
jgi:uncharacterized protein (TIGR00304 family)